MRSEYSRWIDEKGIGSGVATPAPGSPSQTPSTSTQQPLGRANFSTPTLNPSTGETVGVAQSVVISIQAAIDDKKTAEKALRITTDPVVEGKSPIPDRDRRRQHPHDQRRLRR